MKYAVYVVVIEDTEENDMRISDLYPESMDRVAGNVESDDAHALADELRDVGKDYDRGIAR